ncbi:MAG TPA: hypothetical protein VH210_01770 [Gaiellaceae bacterium]|jgi:hypothetical protein|nr:hypothetical protein [Gaiellaceae bacterium]
MNVELARLQWQDGNRRVEATRPNRDHYLDLSQQVDVVVAGLRKRVGQVFTLDELAAAYDGADEWARELIEDASDPDAPPAAEAGTVADAAFHVYARGAVDYRP